MPEGEEQDLIKRCLAGNRQAYAQMVDTYQVRLYNYALYILQNEEEAEEVVQDVFLKAFNSLASFRMESKLSTWLLTVTRNTCLTYLRKKKLDVLDLELHHSLAFNEDSIAHLTNEQDVKRVLTFALRALTEDEKEIVTLYYYNEQSIKEICDITGKTAANTKIILHRSRKKMLKKLNVIGIKEWVT